MPGPVKIFFSKSEKRYGTTVRPVVPSFGELAPAVSEEIVTKNLAEEKEGRKVKRTR